MAEESGQTGGNAMRGEVNPHNTTYRPGSEETKGWVVSSPSTVPPAVEGPFVLPPSTSGPSVPAQQPEVEPSQASPPPTSLDDQ